MLEDPTFCKDCNHVNKDTIEKDTDEWECLWFPIMNFQNGNIKGYWPCRSINIDGACAYFCDVNEKCYEESK